MSQPIKTLTDETFQRAVQRSPNLVLVVYMSEWSTPRRTIETTMNEFATTNVDRLTIATLDVNENHATPIRYGIRGLPSMMLFKDGQPLATLVGSISKRILQTFLKAHTTFVWH